MRPAAFLTLAVAVCPLACATVKENAEPVAILGPEGPAPRRDPESMPAPGVAVDTPICQEPGSCVSYVFRRAAGCGDKTFTWGKRDLRKCAGEDRMEVLVAPDGRVATRHLARTEPRNPYPVELALQWRHCPFAADRNLQRFKEKFVQYQDPDIGICYILRDLPEDDIGRLAKPANFRLLDGLHPYLADATRRLVLAAKAEGIDVKVISGYRPFTAKAVWVSTGVKKKGKVVKVKTKKTIRKKGLHAWGLAVDVNLSHRNDLGSASAAYRNGSERKAWDRIGELAESFGLFWLGRMDSNEIFHFEWRPTWSGLPRGEIRMKIAVAESKKGREGVWELLRYDPSRPSAFRHLRDNPNVACGPGFFGHIAVDFSPDLVSYPSGWYATGLKNRMSFGGG